MMRPINVISLFDGMGGALSALKKADIPVANYFASEIEKHPMKIAKALHPSIQHIGCVKGVLAMLDSLPPIDVWIAGSPCQGFSSAGEGLNFNDPRSRLLFDAVDVLAAVRKRNPNVKFLLENVVPQKKEWAAGISQLMGIDPININSNLLSAQNRDRLYWTNIGLDYNNLFGVGVPGIKQPKDKGIVLRDVLEKEVDDKYYLSEHAIQRLIKGTGKIEKFKWKPIFRYDEKSKPITTEPGKIRSSNNFIVETVDGEELSMEYLKVDKDGKVKLNQDKASTLTAGGNSGGNHSDMDLFIFQHGRGYNKGGEHHEKSPTLTGQSWQNNNHVVSVLDFKVRRLTPREFGRLQTYSEEELDIILGAGVKDTNLFKMFGNGFTRDVIAYILEHLKNELP
jgi:site-specific DNA-cytosine methylase